MTTENNVFLQIRKVLFTIYICLHIYCLWFYVVIIIITVIYSLVNQLQNT